MAASGHYRPVADKHIAPAGMVGLPPASDVLRLSKMSDNQSTFVQRRGLRRSLVLWNTIYIDAAVSMMRKEGFLVRDQDVARLSPLGLEHINMLGRYTFTLPDQVARGKLRPLRDPKEV